MNLTKTERLILYNEFRILEKLYPEEARHYQEAQTILQYGYVSDYSSFSDHLTPDEFADAKAQEVVGILTMYRAIENAYQGLEDKTAIEDRLVQFMGFDGNNEGEYLGYLRFLIATGRFTDVVKTDLNSHRPVLHTYQRMLELWQESADRYHLTRADLIRIVEPRAFGASQNFHGEVQ